MSPRIPMLQLLLALAITSPALVGSSSGAGSGGVTCAALDSLTRLTDFFVRNGDKFDADGYFGLSLAATALKTAPSTGAKVADACGDAGLVELARTTARIERLLHRFRSRPNKSAYDGATYRQICRPIETVMRHIMGSHFLGRHEAAATGNDTGSIADSVAWVKSHIMGLQTYNEKKGDACFKILLSTKNGRCTVSPTCKRYFLHSTYNSGYAMTHQLVYWMSGYEKSCHLKMSDGRPVDRSLMDDSCRQIYPEYKRLTTASSQSGLSGLIDLAIEEAIFCSILGHRDFITDSTTLTLRRMQNERLGCIVTSGGGGSSSGTTGASTGRKLMHDVTLDGICSAHTSGLAAAYISLSLRT